METVDDIEEMPQEEIPRRKKKWYAAITAPLLLLVAFIVVVGVYSNFHTPPEVDITLVGFSPQNIVLTEGESINFVNKSSVTQVICIGSNQRCDSTAIDPTVFDPSSLAGPGIRIAPGQGEDVTFTTYDTYTITSATSPGLNLTVIVNSAT
jgi:plastocyanin